MINTVIAGLLPALQSILPLYPSCQSLYVSTIVSSEYCKSQSIIAQYSAFIHLSRLSPGRLLIYICKKKPASEETGLCKVNTYYYVSYLVFRLLCIHPSSCNQDDSSTDNKDGTDNVEDCGTDATSGRKGCACLVFNFKAARLIGVTRSILSRGILKLPPTVRIQRINFAIPIKIPTRVCC